MRYLVFAGVLFVTELINAIDASVRSAKLCEQASKRQPLEEVIDSIVEEMSRHSECILFIVDPHYKNFITFHWSTRRGSFVVPVYLISIRESESFYPAPRARVKSIVSRSKEAGCDAYVILMANPLGVSEFLRYAEKFLLKDPSTWTSNEDYLRAEDAVKSLKVVNDSAERAIAVMERMIDTGGSFLLIHDWRLFEESSRYLWNRITNVVFIRRLRTSGAGPPSKRRSGERVNDDESFNLETVDYPVQVQTFVLTRYLDTWYHGKFRYAVDHFAPKTRDLRRKSLKVAVLEHIPAVTRRASRAFQRYVEQQSDRTDDLDKAFGIEFELVKIIAKKMNFQADFYAPYGIAISKWGRPGENETFDGLIGESLNGKAAFLIGDLHNTPRHNRLLDLSLPYNTECLTFLTPEALNDNSWKLLIVPFKMYTWIAVILTLVLGAYIFHLFALTYRKYMSLHHQSGPRDRGEREVKDASRKKKRSSSSSSSRVATRGETLQSLDLFTEPGNSIMYTYGMLLQVSLPRIPTAWAVRVFIGWWWLYGILVTVAYRASMTATLANPISRVTIDTIGQLVNSKIAVGGWTDEQRELFLSSSDVDIRNIGERFELTSNEEAAIARVANGSFCYYENIYVLKEAKARRQQLEYNQRRNATKHNEIFQIDRDLHIMQECLIDMPISIGMDKNSPLKPRVDRTIRQVVEGGFVVKWLSDVTEWTNIVELRFKLPPEKTLVNLHKLHGALVALGIGYFCGALAFVAEILYWKYIVERNPYYDKYQMDVFYAKTQRRK